MSIAISTLANIWLVKYDYIMTTANKILIYLISLFLLIAIAYVNEEIYSPQGNIDSTRMFVIENGQGAKEISFNLEEGGIIKNPYLFLLYVYARGNYRDIQAGEYLLSSGMSVSDIVNMLVNGKTAQEKLTIIEGWDLRDLAGYFEKQGLSSKDELYKITGVPTGTNNNINISEEILNGKPEGLSLEGYIFPDTYYYKKGDSAETIIKRAVENLDERLTPELSKNIKDRGKSIFEIITMASLIEKEVRTPQDKAIVSGILWKRLANGMGLQVDSTVLYATGKENSKVYTVDTKFNSPYNTYKYRGLPLGPICSPGMDSIIAAVMPTKSDYLYYLSAPNGKTIFSKTLEEHNYNKAKYLK